MPGDAFTISRLVCLAAALALLWSIRTNFIDWCKSRQATHGVIRSASYDRQPGIYSHAPFRKRHGNTFLTSVSSTKWKGRKFTGHRVNFDESLVFHADELRGRKVRAGLVQS